VVERSVIDLHVSINREQNLYNGLERLFASIDIFPDRLINIIIYSDTFIREDMILRMILKYEKDSLHRRMNVFNSESEASRFRFFQVSDKIDAHNKMDQGYCLVTPVYMISDKSLRFTKQLHGESAVLVKSGVYDSVSGFLKKTFSEDPQFVAFQSEDEMMRFYNDIGGEYTRLPYDFGLVDV